MFIYNIQGPLWFTLIRLIVSTLFATSSTDMRFILIYWSLVLVIIITKIPYMLVLDQTDFKHALLNDL
jgi:hypothetical protein